MDNNFDFSGSHVPSLTPLKNSFVENDFESEIKDLFISLFKDKLGVGAFDVLAGLSHLGSFDFVQKSINADGLSLLRGSADQHSTRYLYRAWSSGDVQKRGIFLLSLYVKLLFGSLGRVTQAQQDKNKPYTVDLEDYSPDKPIKDGFFLTSRVFVDIDSSLATEDIKSISSSIQSVLPARFVPQIRFITLTSSFSTTLKVANNFGLTAHFMASGKLS